MTPADGRPCHDLTKPAREDLMAATLGNIAFDCDDVLKVATFGSAALGRPLAAGASKFFASIGGADPRRQQPAWYFAKVPEPKRAKNRLHLDLVDPDRAAVGRLRDLGATVTGEHQLGDGGHG